MKRWSSRKPLAVPFCALVAFSAAEKTSPQAAAFPRE